MLEEVVFMFVFVVVVVGKLSMDVLDMLCVSANPFEKLRSSGKFTIVITAFESKLEVILPEVKYGLRIEQ
jgi:hypothetical protein